MAAGWVVAVIAFFVVTWLSSDDLFRRIEFGLLGSSIAGLLCFAAALRHKLNLGETPDQESVMEAITDMPFET